MIIEEIKIGKSKIYQYDNEKFDSKEEIYFLWYLEELKKNGFVESYHYHPKSFDLTKGFYYSAVVKCKKKDKTVIHTLAQPQTYTPDFVIVWNAIGVNKFCKSLIYMSDYNFIADNSSLKEFFWCQDVPYVMTTYVDVKPPFNKRNSDAAIFSLKRALMLQMHKIHVQKVIIDDCFAKTFTPQRFLKCDQTDRKRKINWEIKLLRN